jgi:hypothetical protein
MLRLSGGQVESLWDEVLPIGVRELPGDLAALDVVLRDPVLLAPVVGFWECEAAAGRASVGFGRPTIAIETYVRLMVVKHRTGWGYETLVREVSDSLHLRRFCLIALGECVPEESTVRKLTRRLGGAVIDELTRLVIEKAVRETRFRARAVRIDSTVVEADVRYPTDSGLTVDGARVLARESRRVIAKVGAGVGRVVDRTRALGRRLRLISRTLARRTGERKAEVLALTEQAGRLLSKSIREARRVAVAARRRARGRGARAKLAAIERLEEMTDRAERVARQIKLRLAGEPIPDRLVSMFDPDARPIRKGKLGIAQRVRLRGTDLRGDREHQARGARVHPARLDGPRQPAGEHAAPDHHQRASAPRPAATRSRARRWLPDASDRRSARRPGARTRVHRWPPTARVAANTAPPRALPRRRRGPHQPPQTRIRTRPIPAQGRRRDARLERLGDHHLQP